MRALHENLRLNDSELPTYPNHRAQPSQKEIEGKNTILEPKTPLDYSTLFFFFLSMRIVASCLWWVPMPSSQVPSTYLLYT